MFSGECCKSEFDSTYPVQLNGIISPDEFQQSINNINQSISSAISLIICALIFILFVVGGVILCIVGGQVVKSSSSGAIPTLVAGGLALIGFGLLLGCFVCFIIPIRRTSRIQQAVVLESSKYSSRSPTPCTWRLHAYTVGTGGRGGGSKTVYKVNVCSLLESIEKHFL